MLYQYIVWKYSVIDRHMWTDEQTDLDTDVDTDRKQHTIGIFHATVIYRNGDGKSMRLQDTEANGELFC